MKVKIVILLSLLFLSIPDNSDAQVLKVASKVGQNIIKKVKFKSPQKVLKPIKLATKSITKKSENVVKIYTFILS